MRQTDAKPGVRVVDDFGAIGTIIGDIPHDSERRLVKWDGDDEPHKVHVSRMGWAE